MKKARIIVQILFLIIFLVTILAGKTVLWLGIFGVSFIGALIFGRFYCGYICPMNTTMRISTKIAKRFHLQTDRVPKWMEKKVVPWIVLILMIATMILSKRIFHMEIPVLLVLVLISILFTLRYEEWIFHNHICPYGALLRMTGRWARIATKVGQSKCIGCGKCENVCQAMAVKVDSGSKKAIINTAICHQCQECSIVCPVEAIQYKSRNK